MPRALGPDLSDMAIPLEAAKTAKLKEDMRSGHTYRAPKGTR